HGRGPPQPLDDDLRPQRHQRHRVEPRRGRARPAPSAHRHRRARPRRSRLRGDDMTSTAPSARPVPPRGRTWELAAGPYRAGIAAVGAIVEHLTVDGRDLLVRNPATGPMQFYRGAIVAPWPNRIGDGRYTWDGQEIQAPLTEPDRGNALHGLVSFQLFEEVSSSPEAVTLRTLLYPSP